MAKQTINLEEDLKDLENLFEDEIYEEDIDLEELEDEELEDEDYLKEILQRNVKELIGNVDFEDIPEFNRESYEEFIEGSKTRKNGCIRHINAKCEIDKVKLFKLPAITKDNICKYNLFGFVESNSDVNYYDDLYDKPMLFSDVDDGYTFTFDIDILDHYNERFTEYLDLFKEQILDISDVSNKIRKLPKVDFYNEEEQDEIKRVDDDERLCGYRELPRNYHLKFVYDSYEQPIFMDSYGDRICLTDIPSGQNGYVLFYLSEDGHTVYYKGFILTDFEEEIENKEKIKNLINK